METSEESQVRKDGAPAVSSSSSTSSSRKPIVCFLGPVSSYTHQATLETFDTDEYQLVPVVTIKDVFDTTQSGAATYGVVPFENSTNGSVVFTLDHFADRSDEYADLNVCREIYLDVHHCILGQVAPGPSSSSSSQDNLSAGGISTTTLSSSSSAIPTTTTTTTSSSSPSMSGQCTPTTNQPDPQRPRSRPLHPLGHVRRLYSHPQAFGQCTRFLATYLRGVETVDVSSTSRAAELVGAEIEDCNRHRPRPRRSSGGGRGGGGEVVANHHGGGGGGGSSCTCISAAIGSSIAAELLGLDVLARNVEDREDNTTRFFVLRKGTVAAAVAAVAATTTAITTTTTTTTTTTCKNMDCGKDMSTSKPAEEETEEEENVERRRSRVGHHTTTTTKSLVSFVVPHHAPGALADVLDCFRRGGLNLTSINSRPSLREPFQYIFFVEFEFGFEGGGDDDHRVRKVLDEGVARVAQSWRWLGSWENNRPRTTATTTTTR